MAPFNIASFGAFAEPIVHVLIGLGFGFILERAGFGSAKKLTNQFYLSDMTVLKVMFTAIVTAMVLVVAATTFGLLSYDALWVNPTYLGSGVVGGILFGIGFVVGGYCPGTALVSLATLKLDGVLFVAGVLLGILAFGYSEPLIDAFFNDSGNLGRFTLMDLFGLPMPVVALLVLALAFLFFAGAEWIERLMRGFDPSTANMTIASRSSLRRAVIFGATLTTLTGVVAMLWPVSESLRTRTAEARIESQIRAQKVQISAKELADLMLDRTLPLALLDLRDEALFNQAHLLDAKCISGRIDSVRALPASTVKVLLAEDESRALDAYRKLALSRVENLYVLANGLRDWRALFDSASLEKQPLAAVGASHPTSRPPPAAMRRGGTYVPKVKRPGLGAKRAGGGCGG